VREGPADAISTLLLKQRWERVHRCFCRSHVGAMF